MKTYPHRQLLAVTRFLLEALLMFAVVGALTSGIILIAGAPVGETFYHIIQGSLGSLSKIKYVLKLWMPLTIIACGLLYTFRIGLWNIGVEGQVVMGAVVAAGVLRCAGAEPNQPVLLIALALLGALAGGALWALAAGFLKTQGGVHEIFAGLGMNFVAQGFILWLIFGPWKRPGIASMSGTEIFPDSLWLSMPEGFTIPPAGVALTIISIALTAFLLLNTRVGLRLKAVGANARASVLFGLNPDVWVLVAMLLAGGFAGLAGGLQVCGVYHRLIPNISSDYGYLALLVVMLANYRIGYVPFIAFFFACLNVGSIQLPMMLELDSSLSGIIQGSLVLGTLAVQALRMRFKTGAAL